MTGGHNKVNKLDLTRRNCWFFLCLLRNKVNKSNHYANINHRRADFFIISTLSLYRIYLHGRALWCSTLYRYKDTLWGA